MNSPLKKAEIITYQPNDQSTMLEVRIEEETVWLTQAQMVELFKATKQNISLHINNIFRERELNRNSVVKEYLTTASDGKKYKTKFYNLDVTISVGYRVKSKRGTQFRIWANKILKEYLLRGYVLQQRIEKIETKLIEHDQKFDAHTFVSRIIKSAKSTIVLIDNYIDESVLVLLSKRKSNVKATIYSSNITKQLKLDIERFNEQ